MCGLAGGMSSHLNKSELDRIKMLMVLATFRGTNGSGAFVVHPGKKKTLGISICKTEFCAAELTAEPSFVEAINRSPKIVSAHARAPTKGGNEIENVHPHKFGHIIGVHNGTMWDVMGDLLKDNVSDSAAIFKAIAEHGVEAFIKNSRGAYSLVWTDAKEGTLNFLRNDQRPMVFASCGWGGRTHTMYWSSEIGMLNYMFERDRVDKKDIKLESPKPWQHVKFPLDVKHEIIPLEIKQYENPVVIKPVVIKNWTRGWDDEWNDPYNDSTDLTNDIEARVARQKADREARAKEDAARQARLPAIIDNRNRPHSSMRTPSMLPPVEDILNRRTASGRMFRFETNPAEITLLLKGGGCCICDDTPAEIVQRGTVVRPKIYPVKFGSGWPQYICDDCVRTGNPIAVAVLAPAPTLN